jgi:hypothetical protein
MKHRGGEQNRLEYRSVIEALNPQRTAQPPGEIAPVGHVGLLHLHSLSGTSDIGKQSVAGSFYSGVDEKGRRRDCRAKAFGVRPMLPAPFCYASMESEPSSQMPTTRLFVECPTCHAQKL